MPCIVTDIVIHSNDIVVAHSPLFRHRISTRHPPISSRVFIRPHRKYLLSRTRDTCTTTDYNLPWSKFGNSSVTRVRRNTFYPSSRHYTRRSCAFRYSSVYGQIREQLHGTCGAREMRRRHRSRIQSRRHVTFSSRSRSAEHFQNGQYVLGAKRVCFIGVGEIKDKEKSPLCPVFWRG